MTPMKILIGSFTIIGIITLMVMFVVSFLNFHTTLLILIDFKGKRPSVIYFFIHGVLFACSCYIAKQLFLPNDFFSFFGYKVGALLPLIVFLHRRVRLKFKEIINPKIYAKKKKDKIIKLPFAIKEVRLVAYSFFKKFLQSFIISCIILAAFAAIGMYPFDVMPDRTLLLFIVLLLIGISLFVALIYSILSFSCIKELLVNDEQIIIIKIISGSRRTISLNEVRQVLVKRAKKEIYLYLDIKNRNYVKLKETNFDSDKFRNFMTFFDERNLLLDDWVLSGEVF